MPGPRAEGPAREPAPAPAEELGGGPGWVGAEPAVAGAGPGGRPGSAVEGAGGGPGVAGAGPGGGPGWVGEEPGGGPGWVGEEPGGPADMLLAEFGLPDDAPDQALRRVTRLAARLCRTPAAVVNLLGSCVQHQVAEAGFDGGDSPIQESMCALAMRQSRLRYLPDAATDPAFAENPWVDGRLAHVRLYASAPLVLPDGRTLGSLCVFSDQPGSLEFSQRAGLTDLAETVVELFEQRRLLRRAQTLTAELQASEETLRLVAEGSRDIIAVLGQDARVLWVSPSVETVLGYRREEVLAARDPAARVHPDDQAALADLLRHTFRLARTTTVDLRFEDASGGWRSLAVTCTPVVDDDQLVRRLHVVAHVREPVFDISR